MRPPPAGRLDRAVRIERRVDGVGAWAVAHAQIWAAVTPRRGGDEVIAGRLQGTAIVDVVIRTPPPPFFVQAGDRVVALDTGEIWRVAWCDDIWGERSHLLLQCESGAGT